MFVESKNPRADNARLRKIVGMYERGCRYRHITKRFGISVGRLSHILQRHFQPGGVPVSETCLAVYCYSDFTPGNNAFVFMFINGVEVSEAVADLYTAVHPDNPLGVYSSKAPDAKNAAFTFKVPDNFGLSSLGEILEDFLAMRVESYLDRIPAVYKSQTLRDILKKEGWGWEIYEGRKIRLTHSDGSSATGRAATSIIEDLLLNDDVSDDEYEEIMKG